MDLLIWIENVTVKTGKENLQSIAVQWIAGFAILPSVQAQMR
jgi:hypothetical protein